ncbi:MAG: Lacal_2735 family protein [Crocinitomix sp.]|nr:Lacal_2735 family protein [Crocinitomix sp.]
MFKLFKKKSPVDKMYNQYEKLLAEAHQLSTINRTASDEKTAEANAILDKIDALKN